MWPFSRRERPRTQIEQLEHWAAQGVVECQYKLGLQYVDIKVIGPNDARGLAYTDTPQHLAQPSARVARSET